LTASNKRLSFLC